MTKKLRSVFWITLKWMNGRKGQIGRESLFFHWKASGTFFLLSVHISVYCNGHLCQRPRGSRSPYIPSHHYVCDYVYEPLYWTLGNNIMGHIFVNALLKQLRQDLKGKTNCFFWDETRVTLTIENDLKKMICYVIKTNLKILLLKLLIYESC